MIIPAAFFYIISMDYVDNINFDFQLSCICHERFGCTIGKAQQIKLKMKNPLKMRRHRMGIYTQSSVLPMQELSVRRDPCGAGLMPEVYPLWITSPQGKSRVIIFIHGFNNNAEEAQNSYVKLFQLINSFQIGKIFLKDSWYFYWPGNTLYFSSIRFPEQIKNARRSGFRLATYISTLRGPHNTVPEIILIGHSLGCRVILEALGKLSRKRPENRPWISLICLFAAAVPTNMIYFKKTWLGIHIPSSRMNLFSPKDKILRWWFGLGELFSPDRIFPEAVGLNGRPNSPEIWNIGNYNMMIDHGDYWKNKDVATKITSGVFKVIKWGLNTNNLPKNEVSYLSNFGFIRYI